MLSTITGRLIGPLGDTVTVTAKFTGDSAILVFEFPFTGSAAHYRLELDAFDTQTIVAYHAAGDVTIKAGDNQSVAAPAFVYAAPDTALHALHVNPAALVLNAGAAAPLTVAGTGASGQNVPPLRIGWTSRDPSVASVDENGGVHAGSFQGSTWIVARTATNIADSAQVKVHAPVDRVIVAPGTVQVIRGQSAAVSAELRDAGNHLIDDRSATFASSDPTVATVSAVGAIQGIKIGSASITATAEGKTATASVAVVSPVDHVELAPTALTFASLHETQAVTTRIVARTGASVSGLAATLSSSNSGVATVDASGNVTAVANGSASITATVDGISTSAAVTVRQVAVSVAISPKSAGVTALGDTRAFSAVVLDALGSTVASPAVSWSSSNPTVASVSGDGVAAGKTPGTATITLAMDGKSDAATFTVSQVPRLLFANADRSQIRVGETATLTARVADANGNPISNVNASWTTTTPSIVTLTTDGHATGAAIGAARIDASAGGLSSSLFIQVVANPSAPGGTASGVVVNALTGAAINGATVTSATNTTATTATDGSFTLANVSNGSTLSIAAAGFVSTQYFNVQARSGTAQLGTLPLAPTSTASGSFSGRVVDALSGFGIPGALLAARAGINATSGTVLQQVTADQSGNYFGTLPAGTYTVTASATGYATANGTVPAIGDHTTTNQNIILSPSGLSSGSYRIVLQWNATPPDLDSHLVGPKGNGTNFEIYYNSLTFSGQFGIIAQLDHDETDGFGPETITLNQTIAGHYRYYVHKYCCSESFAVSGARVTVFRGDVIAAQFNVPAGDGLVWTVFELDGATGGITSINTLSPTYIIPGSGSGSFNVIPLRGGVSDIQALLDRVRAHPKKP